MPARRRLSAADRAPQTARVTSSRRRQPAPPAPGRRGHAGEEAPEAGAPQGAVPSPAGFASPHPAGGSPGHSKLRPGSRHDEKPVMTEAVWLNKMKACRQDARAGR